MKRILCVMLSLCLLLAAAPFAVSAAGDESGTTGACTWTFNSDSSTLTISGNGAMADYYSGAHQENHHRGRRYPYRRLRFLLSCRSQDG